MLISPSKTLFKDCAVSKNKESDQQVFFNPIHKFKGGNSEENIFGQWTQSVQ